LPFASPEGRKREKKGKERPASRGEREKTLFGKVLPFVPLSRGGTHHVGEKRRGPTAPAIRLRKMEKEKKEKKGKKKGASSTGKIISSHPKQLGGIYRGEGMKKRIVQRGKKRRERGRFTSEKGGRERFLFDVKGRVFQASTSPGSRREGKQLDDQPSRERGEGRRKERVIALIDCNSAILDRGKEKRENIFPSERRRGKEEGSIVGLA